MPPIPGPPTDPAAIQAHCAAVLRQLAELELELAAATAQNRARCTPGGVAALAALAVAPLGTPSPSVKRRGQGSAPQHPCMSDDELMRLISRPPRRGA